ncbi:hypothetical protein YG5714_0582 [Sulfolobus islandicus Y.G.57.14]|uniref:Uncharacterized protein n=1 Tax=Saccharolobus islandicus (strain Y.G.57.14 / Yellowstone \|nr:hypothetical protein [Sulfolobus islandicus]ACP44877.1 hypothetical protein YG5714_0582 [Sulfolobus islandicus Y.G.57.14]
MKTFNLLLTYFLTQLYPVAPHRDVVALYNLARRAGDVSPVPLGSKESHDPPTVSGWLRAKSLHSIMNDYKMIEMKV